MKTTKLIARLTPVSTSLEVDASGVYSGAVLGKLLMPLAGIDLAFKDKQSGVITRAKAQDYVRGLKDAGVLHANDIYNMLCKHESVTVDVFEVEDKP